VDNHREGERNEKERTKNRRVANGVREKKKKGSCTGIDLHDFMCGKLPRSKDRI